jgi:16S rRNA (cytosine967-C5)-methyltransferase
MSRQPSPARSAAFRILEEVTRKGPDPASLLHGRATQKLQSTDRNLTTEIVYGVLRWQNRLDFILHRHAKRAGKAIDFPILLALRIGLYQIRFLSRIPERSAVDESVKLARRFGPRGASGFVNAVLRSTCRQPDKPALPSKNEDPLGYLTITLSHPEWLARRYLGRLGVEGAEIRCLYHNQAPPTDIRVEPGIEIGEAQKQLAEDGIPSAPHPVVPRCLRAQSGRPTAGSLYRSGSIYMQEAGSQLIPYMLDVQRGVRVLDACAAPGSKATQMSRWSHPGKVIALERRLPRIELLASIAKQWRCDNLLPVGGDAGELPFRSPFHRILLDAPCSSLGTLARNPDIKWRLNEENLRDLADEQYRILSACAGLLAPGGHIVYSTCSTEPEENEEVVERFLSSHPGFSIAAPPPSFPEAARRLLDERGILRTLPERDAMDGYFAVALHRKL